LDARLYTAPRPGQRPLTVYLHGGGFVIGGLDTHDEPCRVICAESGSHVLSLAYRLAPEHPFPAGLRDVEAVLRWARVEAASLGADPARVAVAGDSAGGNLATAACLELRGDAALPVAQLLIYPAVDSLTPRPSQRWFDRGYFLSQADRDAFSRYYLTGTGATDAHPLVSPLLAEDLSGLPPALVVIAGFDLLRDEGIAFAERLAAEGTHSELMRVDSLGHGFIHLSGVNRAARDATVALARRWGALLDALPGSSAND
jgi:acetyl esterase